MHENPDKDWTLELLADAAGMSRARFADKFKTATGVTALDCLTDWRIAVGQNMLRRGKPLKLIAPAVGYGSAEAFARVFVRRVGHSPAEWLARRGVPSATNVPYRVG
jgi:AraC-like DNA-binding protein